MNAPSKDPARPNPELDYAPPWARENSAREQSAGENSTRDNSARENTTRENTTRANMARENMAREQLRPQLGERGPVEDHQASERALGGSRTPSDDQPYDRPWHHRALEPELVPEPPEAVPNFLPTMLRLGVVCVIAAMVAAAVVLLFNPKQNAHKSLQANSPPPGSIVEDRTVTAVDPASASGASVQAQPQAVASVMPNQSVANLEAPTARLNQEPPAQPPNFGQPPPQPLSTNPPPREAPPASEASPPVQAAPEAGAATSSPVKQSLAKPAVVLDEDGINTLLKRGNAFLKDGDFAAARLLFERAAGAGSAEGALALGSTYDPLVIKRLGAIAVKPDIENARKWYQIAADRGSAAAKLQLANLPPSH